jgi:hypothetical protein
MSSHLSQVIPPGQTAGFDIVFCRQWAWSTSARAKMQGRVFPESKLKFTDGQDAAAVPQLEIEEAEIDWIAGASHHLDFQILVA